jgi:hypothetical protein
LRHADPRALDSRFTIGRALALTWRAWLACRWPIILIGLPTAVAQVICRWFVYAHFNERIPERWQEMVYMWLDVSTGCIGFVSITLAALRYASGTRTGARDVFRIPWRRLPAALVASLILQTIAYWPTPLLSWPDDGGPILAVDYAILAVNVLTADVLTFVWLPVMLAESRSVIATVQCSIQLVKRHPWRILAIDLGLWAMYFAFSEAAPHVYVMVDPRRAALAWSVITGLWIFVMMSLGCCLVAAAYHLIRTEQEGPAPEALARVFD